MFSLKADCLFTLQSCHIKELLMFIYLLHVCAESSIDAYQNKWTRTQLFAQFFYLFPQNKILRPFAMSSFAATINVLILFLALRDDEMGETDDDHGKRFKTEEEEKTLFWKTRPRQRRTPSLSLSFSVKEYASRIHTMATLKSVIRKKEKEREGGGKSRERGSKKRLIL